MLLLQPQAIIGNENIIFESEVASTVPYMPDQPHLTRNFNVPRISITEAAQKNADLVICGMPGSGKTVALAYLVSCLVQKDPKCGLLSSKIPFYVNVHDTEIITNPDLSIFDMLYKALSPRLPGSILPRLIKFINECIEENNAILVIDALDELPPDDFDKFVDFIKKNKQIYPNLQIILSSTPLYLGELLSLNFTPLFLSAWSNQQIVSFYLNWNKLWKLEILKNINLDDDYNETLVQNWAMSNLRPLSPIEYTMHIWGALAGDLFGSSTLDLYQTYTKRILPVKEVYDLAISLAQDLIQNKNYYLNAIDTKADGFNKLLHSEIIQTSSNGKLTFFHSELVGYFASLSPEQDYLSDLNESDLQWPANYAYLGFNSSQDSECAWLTNFLTKEQSNSPFDLFNIGSWLKITNKNLNWRVNFIKQLVKIIQNGDEKITTRIRAIGTLVLSNDNNLPTYFRQLLTNNNDFLKELSLYAISCSSRDNSFLPDLISLSQKSSSDFQKNVCLALATFEDENAVHELARILLNGEEKVRLLVAESLVINPSIGTEILQEAVTLEDIVVRRASINGLVKLNNLWSIQTLKTLMIEDSQWVVRNGAAQALEYLESGNPYIPERKLPLSETPWVIEFAGNQNLGVSSDQSVAPVLLMALNSQNRKDMMNAIIYSVQDANQATVSKMVEIASKSHDSELINQIFLTLYLLRNSKISNLVF
jgi:HEAT repeat protein